jgi:hypothetical protein
MYDVDRTIQAELYLSPRNRETADCCKKFFVLFGSVVGHDNKAPVDEDALRMVQNYCFSSQGGLAQRNPSSHKYGTSLQRVALR